MVKTLTAMASIATSMLWQVSAQAQVPWPNKPIRFIGSGAAASGTDLVARTFTDAMAKTFGQPIVVDNKPGANGLIATEAAATAPIDGYHFLFTYAEGKSDLRDWGPIVKTGSIKID